MDPTAFTIGALDIRWYGILMAAAFFIGYFILQRLAREEKISQDLIDVYFIYIFLGIIIGARLGEIIFYDPAYYYAYPIEIFKTWHGGLSSHGGFIGGILATFIFCRRHKISFYKIADIAVIPIALGSVFVRIGNFINGEIVGRVTNVPWAVRFDGYEGLRHPSQIYEAIMNFFVFMILLGIRSAKRMKKANKMPEGLVFWSFVSVYSFLRFFIEFFKDFQGVDNGWPITMGQALCLAFLAVSIYFMTTKYGNYVGNIFIKRVPR